MMAKTVHVLAVFLVTAVSIAVLALRVLVEAVMSFSLEGVQILALGLVEASRALPPPPRSGGRHAR